MSFCEFCAADPCECAALTRPVPWVEAQLSSREVSPGVYDMDGAPEAVRAEFERIRVEWGERIVEAVAEEGS